ncbi:MAG: hypothetical protein ACI8SE_000947 [Bacteroidia bacterium]|jgi:hypothetical protein
MRYLTLLCVGLSCLLAKAQLDISAAFPGGDNAYNDYLLENLEFPEKAINARKSRKIRVVVEIDTVGKVRIQSFVYPKGVYGFEEEVERFVNAMPTWTPVLHNGIVSNSQMVLNFQFDYVDPDLDYDTQHYTFYKESEVPPNFVGGLDSIKSFLKTMLVDTFEFSFDTTEVTVQFVVGVDSSIIDASILESDNKIPDDYWIYIVRSLPNAIPGRIRNKPVNVQSTLSLEVVVESETDN